MTSTKKKKIFIFGLEALKEKKDNYNDVWRIENYFPKYATKVEKPAQADLILVVGGDGTMLKAIRTLRKFNKPFCGLNFGHLGFLLNEPGHATVTLSDICEDKVEIIKVRLLEITQNYSNAKSKTFYAFNDLVIERTKPQTAKIKIMIDAKTYFDPLTCDGVIVSSAAGSTSYNGSAGGIVVPINTNSIVLTGICPAVFEKWNSSLLPEDSFIQLEPVEREKRPVRFIADGQRLPNCQDLTVQLSDKTVSLMFLTTLNFRQKVMGLQFRR
jgi:NAD+ kinase